MKRTKKTSKSSRKRKSKRLASKVSEKKIASKVSNAKKRAQLYGGVGMLGGLGLAGIPGLAVGGVGGQVVANMVSRAKGKALTGNEYDYWIRNKRKIRDKYINSYLVNH